MMYPTANGCFMTTDYSYRKMKKKTQKLLLVTSTGK